MSKFIRIYQLKQHTPMIHFQHDDPGACLRASDVKPRLDRFVLEALGLEDPKESPIAYRNNDPAYEKGIKIATDNGWLIGEGAHPALKYKVRIAAIEELLERSDTIETKRRSLEEDLRTRENGQPPIKQYPKIDICRSYFANMVETNKRDSIDKQMREVKKVYRETIFCKSLVEMKVTCFIKELADKLYDLIPAFFLLHNFGTRQSKGFGSFTVQSVDGKVEKTSPVEEIAKRFPNPFYMITYSSSIPGQQMNDIADIYQLMKSGLNFVARPPQDDEYARAYIYSYMHKKGIDNEKAWMKQNQISPAEARKHNKPKVEHELQSNMKDPRYVRAVLGITDRISYISKLDDNDKPIRGPGSRTVVTIESEIETIKRFPSPVFFKVIERKTFIIPYEPHRNIFDKAFTFKGKGSDGINRESSISTPSSASFDMQDFMKEFVKHINDLIAQQMLKQSKRLRFKRQIEAAK